MSANKLVPRDRLNELNSYLLELFLDVSFKQINTFVMELKAGVKDDAMAGVVDELELALQRKTEAIKSKVDMIINYYQAEIFNKGQDNLNDLKKVIYRLMKGSTPGSAENQYFYNMYQELKEGNIDMSEASDLLMKAMEQLLEK